jgi:hypothetical protein
MAFTLNQLSALEAAIASGTLSVSYNGKTVVYRSTTDLLKARDVVRGELMAAGQVQSSLLSNRGPAALAVFSRD